MADPTKPGDDHEERVDKAFDELHESLGERLDEGARGKLSDLRQAAQERDAERLREHLTTVQEEHGWLYRELAAHPGVKALIDELALWGF